MLFSRRPPPRIEFLCEPRDKGVIAEPVPAKAELPEWFRRIPPIDAENLTPTNNGLTVKRCMPFFDALATGWIIPLAATVRLEVTDDGSTVNAGWEFDRTLVSYHGPHQVRGNPREPRPPCKFHNLLDGSDAAGLELPLRAAAQPRQLRVRILAGVVDTDRYASHIHFPFFVTAPDGLYVIHKGTPVAQVIPFRRDDAAIASVIRAETAEESAVRERIFRNTIADEGWYRKEARAAR